MKTNTKLEAHWIIDAPPEEMRLILKALGGRLTAEEVADAKALGDRITRQRADHSRRLADEMKIHEDNARRTT